MSKEKEEKEIIKKPVEQTDKSPEKEISSELTDNDAETGLKVRNNKYFEEIGKRKTAKARVRLFTKGGKSFIVNNKPCKEYFPTQDLQKIASASLDKMNLLESSRFR